VKEGGNKETNKGRKEGRKEVTRWLLVVGCRSVDLQYLEVLYSKATEFETETRAFRE
jgi:hypothetical protein